jgi:transposase-like protein
MDCPKCENSESTKDGVVKKKQRYKCKSCGYHYTVELKSTSKSKNTKRQALELYLEGLGFRSIGRFLNVSHVSVYKWIKSYGRDLEDLKSDEKIEVVEMDEMHTYIGHKKTTAGFGYLLIGMEKGLSTAYLGVGGSKLEKSFGKG